jgi:hypothetical protein
MKGAKENWTAIKDDKTAGRSQRATIFPRDITVEQATDMSAIQYHFNETTVAILGT